MMGIIALLMQIVAFGAGVYLAIIGHWKAGLFLVVASQVIHFVIEKTVHALMWLYEKVKFTDEDRQRLGRRSEFATFVSDPNLLPDEAKKMQKDFLVIARIGGLIYIGIVLVLIYQVVLWAKAN